MRVVVTGAFGFLGWHTCVRLRATTDHDVIRVGREEWDELDSWLSSVDTVVHIAGINRGDDPDVEAGNIALAHDVARCVRRSSTVRRVVYAGTVHEETDTAYGRGKRGAGLLLEEAARSAGASYTHVMLPNLFGEHGRPHYNSFVATFVEAVISGKEPTVSDRGIELMHAQQAAEALTEGLATSSPVLRPRGVETTVAEVLRRLCAIHRLYGASGELPDLTDPLSLDLFNTYRARLFPEAYPIHLFPHEDERGRLVETARSRAGGQSFVSTTVPGAIRGEHFHLRKVERFVVVDGTAVIRLRRVLHDEVVEFAVSGDRPAAVDMPTMWVHHLQNTGLGPLTTLFWADQLFDADKPDTFRERVLG